MNMGAIGKTQDFAQQLGELFGRIAIDHVLEDILARPTAVSVRYVQEQAIGKFADCDGIPAARRHEPL
jgi:hypothetical protein